MNPFSTLLGQGSLRMGSVKWDFDQAPVSANVGYDISLVGSLCPCFGHVTTAKSPTAPFSSPGPASVRATEFKQGSERMTVNKRAALVEDDLRRARA